ncbi:DNA cytosine methyltransferase [Psychrobacillus sp. INOP01]|uniref:DNA cytosine methyltransferase n=1 Tax=Psychrobacillus sp. INOP01 TaxID=2829187 RepID=UPI001BABF8F2|nr:DNA cytosine methyltransferase [Psychrobacillus sp. INOP01]QUG42634.1 DNA cytosine methyltransferase [Psychrobacillus sp. INOP01]
MGLNLNGFKMWLAANKDYCKETISDTVSRMKRADNILPWFNDIVYQFRLEQELAYQALSVSVRSQIKKSVKLYFDYIKQDSVMASVTSKGSNMKVLSLFSNIGVAESYFEDMGIEVSVANELVERRAKLYSKIYPDTHMICGDITKKNVFDDIVKESRKAGVNIIMATPPCQGMSTAGQQEENDERNKLIIPVIEAVKEIRPQYVFLENVPMFLNTSIEVNGEQVLIPNLLEKELGSEYKISQDIIDTKDYSVPQTRERAIILMTRRTEDIKEWGLPKKDSKIVTMQDAIGDLPKLDPYIKDVSEDELLEIFPHFYERQEVAANISKWHVPPHHVKRQVIAMQHTRTGCTAFDNTVFYPKKADGEAVKGFRNTYKRQKWNTAAYTVTMDNRKISSQNNVHPGRLEYVDDNGEEIYSDARTLTLYELLIVMSLPESWPVPENTSEAFLRRIIGEGIPPLFVKRVFENIN